MIIDAVTLTLIRRELEDLALQARVERILQPGRGDLLFVLRRGSSEHKLFFASSSPCPWIGLVETPPSNPSQPPAFCMLLRKHLAGGRLLRLDQPPYERHLEMCVEHFDELGGLVQRTLHLELMGRCGNAILADADGRIMDALYRGMRKDLEPGAAYLPPTAGERLNPADLPEGTFLALLSRAPAGAQLADYLRKRLLGLSPSLWLALLDETGLPPGRETRSLSEGEARRLWESLSAMNGRVQRGEFEPCILCRDMDGRVAEFAPFAMEPAPGYKAQAVGNMASAVGGICGRLREEESLEKTRSSLRQRVQKALAKCERKEEKQSGELADAELADVHREHGDLILAHLNDIKKGAAEIVFPAFTDPERMLKIPLDPSLSASANAQACFRRYQRAKRGQKAVAAQLVKTREELDYLKEIEYSLNSAETHADLAETASEMRAVGLLPGAGRDRTRESTHAAPRRYRSADGLEILVGHNNRQNDRLTFSLAGPDDIWLHTRQIPGAHVIVRMSGMDSLPPSTLLEAANLAIYNSRARGGSKVPVDYTERRRVRRRPGGRPGMVFYERFRTVIVDPSQDILDRLFSTEY